MLTLNPARRFLFLPAWFWVLLPIPLFLWARSLPTTWPPTKLKEPPDRAEIFREGIFVTPEGNSFRFLPLAEAKSEKPVWAVNVAVREQFSAEWKPTFLGTGRFQRYSQWTYELNGHRFDDDWKNEKTGEFMLSNEQMKQLRLMVVQELNRRDESKQLGERLASLLRSGVEVRSDLCAQDAVTFSAWLSLWSALGALVTMLLPVRPKPENSELPS